MIFFASRARSFVTSTAFFAPHFTRGNRGKKQTVPIFPPSPPPFPKKWVGNERFFPGDTATCQSTATQKKASPRFEAGLMVGYIVYL